MIRAICFNADVFKEEVRDKILQETGGQWGGWLAEDIQPNCIESFPNGCIYYSLVTVSDTQGVTNCHNDIQRFIYVNSYGQKDLLTAE